MSSLPVCSAAVSSIRAALIPRVTHAAANLASDLAQTIMKPELFETVGQHFVASCVRMFCYVHATNEADLPAGMHSASKKTLQTIFKAAPTLSIPALARTANAVMQPVFCGLPIGALVVDTSPHDRLFVRTDVDDSGSLPAFAAQLASEHKSQVGQLKRGDLVRLIPSISTSTSNAQGTVHSLTNGEATVLFSNDEGEATMDPRGSAAAAALGVPVVRKAILSSRTWRPSDDGGRRWTPEDSIRELSELAIGGSAHPRPWRGPVDYLEIVSPEPIAEREPKLPDCPKTQRAFIFSCLVKELVAAQPQESGEGDAAATGKDTERTPSPLDDALTAAALDLQAAWEHVADTLDLAETCLARAKAERSAASALPFAEFMQSAYGIVASAPDPLQYRYIAHILDGLLCFTPKAVAAAAAVTQPEGIAARLNESTSVQNRVAQGGNAGRFDTGRWKDILLLLAGQDIRSEHSPSLTHTLNSLCTFTQ